MTISLTQASISLRHAIEAATQGLVDRESLAELIVLGAVAGEHVLVIGPPGTGKSQVVRRVAQALGGRYFEYLLGRFTEPNEIFGPVDLRKLREGKVETETAGMLPEAEIAFLDEVFLGSTAILNTLLAILNERRFMRGHTRMNCPLRVCVGASNTIPEEESLAAFADRFLIHAYVEPIGDNQLEALLLGGWRTVATHMAQISDLDHLDVLADLKTKVDMTGVQPMLAHGFRLLRKAGVQLSDRRMVRCQSLIAAAAVLAGKKKADEADFWPIFYAIPTKQAQEQGREVLHEFLAKSRNVTLPAASEESSQSRAARDQRISRQGMELLAEEPEQDRAYWLLKLEGLAREIDAGFPVDLRSQDLRQLYEKLVALIRPEEGSEA